MCKFRFLLLLIFVVLLNSCSKYPADVKHALKLAGDNRIELEKVLEHYSQHQSDSLKYKAACFLIANMPEKYSEKCIYSFIRTIGFRFIIISITLHKKEII